MGPESVAVRAAYESLARVLAVEPSGLPGPQALEDTRVLLRMREQLDAHLLRRLRDVELRGLHDLDALPTIGTWVEAQGSSVDRRMVGLARRIDRLPTVARELDSGRLSMLAAQRVSAAMDQISPFIDRPDGLIDGLDGEAVLEGVIVRGVVSLFGESKGGVADDDPRLLALLADLVEIHRSGVSQAERLEAAFVALAVRVESRFLRPALGLLVDALLPQRLADRSAEAHRRRALALERNDDRPGWRLEGDIDDETGELLHAALTAAMATDPENADDTAAAAEARAGLSDQAPRPKWVRRHDALSRILRDWLGSGIAGSRGKVVPHISVRVGIEALHEGAGALPAVGASGATLPVGVVSRWLCDSSVTRFVMGLGNRVLELSHTERTLKAHERRAKQMETGGRCQAAGCHPPPGTPLIPHHPEAYARSRTTSFFDAVMLCERSHHDLHEGGKTLLLKDGRHLGPDGWVQRVAA